MPRKNPQIRSAGATAGAKGFLLRIIGGEWRGRKIRFPPVAAIRPTPDRVRETLFNWLQPSLPGSRCLDLYAGSGALGLEALSRGAREVVFVDENPAVVRHLSGTLDALGCERGQVIHADARRYLDGAVEPFDVVFLDPPFRQGWIERVLPRLGALLEHPAWLYVESESALAPDIPARLIGPGCEMVRHGRAGQVFYHLVRCP